MIKNQVNKKKHIHKNYSMSKIINKTGYYIRINENYTVGVGGSLIIEDKPIVFEKWWGKDWTTDIKFHYCEKSGNVTLPTADPLLHMCHGPPSVAAVVVNNTDTYSSGEQESFTLKTILNRMTFGLVRL